MRATDALALAFRSAAQVTAERGSTVTRFGGVTMADRVADYVEAYSGSRARPVWLAASEDGRTVIRSAIIRYRGTRYYVTSDASDTYTVTTTGA